MGRAAAAKKRTQRGGLPVADWREAIAVLKDDQLRAALVRQRDGVPAEPGDPLSGMPGKPRQRGVVEILADMLVKRMSPGFEAANDKESIEAFDANIAMHKDILEDLNERLDNANKLRKVYMRDEKED